MSDIKSEMQKGIEEYLKKYIEEHAKYEPIPPELQAAPDVVGVYHLDIVEFQICDISEAILKEMKKSICKVIYKDIFEEDL